MRPLIAKALSVNMPPFVITTKEGCLLFKSAKGQNGPENSGIAFKEKI